MLANDNCFDLSIDKDKDMDSYTAIFDDINSFGDKMFKYEGADCK